MKPLFTVHAGEYLVGAFLEKTFKHANVWIPLKDTGVDLLVSDRRNRAAVSLQVKFSKDFLVTHMKPVFQQELRRAAGGASTGTSWRSRRPTIGCLCFRGLPAAARTSS